MVSTSKHTCLDKEKRHWIQVKGSWLRGNWINTCKYDNDQVKCLISTSMQIAGSWIQAMTRDILWYGHTSWLQLMQYGAVDACTVNAQLAL